MAELQRARLLNGIGAKDARAVALWAPAGFGKSTVARQFVRNYFHCRTVDAGGVRSDAEFAWRVACAFDPAAEIEAKEYDGRENVWIERARRAWRTPFAGAVTFENCERLAQVHGGERFLRELLETTPHPRTIVCCARMPLDVGLARFALPHETYVFGENELAFDREEIRALLECSYDQASIVWEVTRGWPLCVRMIARVARERPLEDVRSRLESASFDSLYDYLLEHLFEVIPEDSRSCSIAFAAIPGCTHQDIVKLYGIAADDLRQRALTSGLVAIRDGKYELHPLLRASMLRRHAAVALERVRSAAAAWREENPERAALLYVEAGEHAEAAAILQSLVSDRLLVAVPPLVHALCRRLPRATVLSYPRLWSHTMLEQSYVDLDGRLREALSVWEKLSPDESPPTRFLVLGVLMYALLGLGRREEAQDYYDRYLANAAESDDEVRLLKATWRVSLACKAGQYVAARAAFECDRPALKTYAGVYAIAMTDVDFACARALGQWPDERMHQDIALHYARESENPSAMLTVLIDCIFGAWLAGDAIQMRRHTDELDALRPLGSAFIRACRTGSADDLDDAERPKTRAYAYLMAASVAPRPRRAALAQRAVAAADVTGDPLLRVVTRAAASMTDGIRRTAWLDEAAIVARGIDAPALREGLDDVRQGKTSPIFAALAGYFSDGAAEPRRYRLIIARQALFRGQERMALTNRETELLCYLGMRETTASIHELAEAIVPHKDSASAGRMLRVLIARVRKRCDPEIVVHDAGGYRLGPHVTVACREILRRFALLRNDRLSEEEVAALRRDLADVRTWSEVNAPAWEWARELDDYIRSLEIKLAARLEATPVAS